MKAKSVSKKGFTLVEILIVIVILAVLAGLILPRVLAQPERALVAEAVNFLGVMRRAQIQLDPINHNVFMDVTTADHWKELGVDMPAANEGSFTYTCSKGTDAVAGNDGADGIAGNADDVAGVAATNATCTAARKAGAKANGTIRMNLASGVIDDCGSPYTLRNNMCW